MAQLSPGAGPGVIAEVPQSLLLGAHGLEEVDNGGLLLGGEGADALQGSKTRFESASASHNLPEAGPD